MTRVLALISIFFIVSCSIPKEKSYRARESLFSILVRPTWFKYHKDRALTDKEGEIVSHPFFDFNPFINFKNRSANFFVVTPQGSEVYYDFDLSSGKRYRKHNLCKRKDAWEKYGSVSYPPYTEGILPRTLDQLGTPQKIWVFGDRELYENWPGEYAHRVKIVGGVIQQYCKNGNCTGFKEWESRIILVGVSPRDSKFDSVRSIESLKKKVNWEEVVAFSSNAAGEKLNFSEVAPTYRLTGIVSARDALKFASLKSHNFDLKDMKDIQKSCHELYDHILVNLGPKSKDKNYYKRFKKIHQKFYKRIFTCMKYVRTSSINHNKEDHWFFSFYEAFYNLHFLDYIYNCSARTWVPRVGNVYAEFDEKTYLKSCFSSDLDDSFEQAILTLSKLRSSYKPSYAYVQYDSSKGGSHEKIYSWVYNDGHSLDCPENKLSGKGSFPRDIKWKKRADRGKGLKGYIK